MPPYESTILNFWSSKTASSQLTADFLLPNGICVKLETSADKSLAELKTLLWLKAKEYPRFEKLRSESEYVFSCVSRRGGLEELVDEERSLFEIKPFKPYLKVVRKQGDEAEKLLNSKISMLIGKSLQDFDNMKVEEVEDFRMKYRNFCESIAQQRGRATWIRRAIYTFPPEFAETQDIPQYIQEKLVEETLKVYVVLYRDESETINKTFSVNIHSYPSDLINSALKKKASTMRLPEPERGEDYVLKIVGKESFLFGSTLEREEEEQYLEYPLIQYKYIRECISTDKRPSLCLVPKCELKVEDRARTFSLVDNPPPLPPKGEKNFISLWDLSPDTMFSIKIVCATNVNAQDMKKSVKCGLFHGGEPLCEIKETGTEAANVNFNQFIYFSIRVIDLPRMARLCLCLYGYTDQKDKKRTGAVPLAWVNTTVFDYKGFLKMGQHKLACWPCDSAGFPQHGLNPIGTVVSNSATDSCPLLLVEFSKFAEPVMFPPYDKVLELAAQAASKDPLNPLTVKGSSRHRAEVEQIVARDPLAELRSEEKELLWYLRAECCDDLPASLPKLLQSMKWNSREDVAQMQFLLKVWRKDMMAYEHALEMLDFKFSDNNVRKFSVELLDEMKDSELELYLIQLVQALKYESYLDCALTRFLLKRALNNRRIGHFLFWNLRSEMQNTEVSVRFGLILEAYCRGSVGHIENLSRQHEAINKLKTVTELLKQSPLRDVENLATMRECFYQPAYQRAFSNITSPLDPSVQLKQLKVEECRYMSSSKKPLWLVFKNQDELGGDIILIFKNGDDLRQDMLTLQLLRIMDNKWKSKGLDLHMSPYGCLSTGLNVGLIEGVANATTIARIQAARGSVRGAIKCDSLFAWLCQSNAKELDNIRKHLVKRFTLSCAGYCVATYVLGIGDRHNDNIMTKTTGEFLHIDFGHFLGNFKSKFRIRRERVPLVLTNDFLFVINDGKGYRESPAVDEFKALCYRAFSLLREKGSLFVTLFALMLSSGIPELHSTDSLEYLRQSLALSKSENESRNHFIEIMKEAQEKSWTTSVNWVVHNIRHYWIG